MHLAPFIDREHAARELAHALEHLRGSRPLVLAIPRGGVPLGRILADRLDGDLDVVLVRKLGAPVNPEYAIGAIDEHGRMHLAANASQFDIDSDYLRRESRRQIELIRQRRERYSGVLASFDPAGRTVIVVDDGLATGETMRAALNFVAVGKPKYLVCAVPVAPPDSLLWLRTLVDEVVCLETPTDFRAVGQYYQHFESVSDDDVAAMLAERGSRAEAGSESR